VDNREAPPRARRPRRNATPQIAVSLGEPSMEPDDVAQGRPPRKERIGPGQVLI